MGRSLDPTPVSSNLAGFQKEVNRCLFAASTRFTFRAEAEIKTAQVSIHRYLKGCPFFHGAVSLKVVNTNLVLLKHHVGCRVFGVFQ